MKNLMRTYGIFLIALLPLSLIGQDKIATALEKLATNYPQEKIYLLYSKNTFVAGDNVWFNAYLFEGYGRSNISTTVFVELYDDQKNMIDRKTVPIFDGTGQGNFTLSDSLPEGIYHIRAYTTWMLNFDESFQYLHSFPVYNATSPSRLEKDTTLAWAATAYPEGGTLIEGVSNKVAVRLSSTGDLPALWSGNVAEVAKPNESLGKFNSLDRNVGVFNFVPEAGKKYQVTVEDIAGKKVVVPLPAAAKTGVALRVESREGEIAYAVNFKGIPATANGFKVVGTINNNLVYLANINKVTDEVSASIPTEQLINGVLRISVLDANNKPLAERLTFVEPLNLKVGQPAFPPLYISHTARGINGFDIRQDTNYLHYNVLVLDGNTEDYLANHNILSTLWLTGDIRSRIDNPGKYFEYDGNIEALDAVLLTEKWKRFDWEKILNDQFPKIEYMPANYIGYKGTVYATGGIAANATVNLIFYFKDSTSQFSQVTTDGKGVFDLDNLLFEEPVQLYYQINDNKIVNPRDVSIQFDPMNKTLPYKGDLPKTAYKLVRRNAGDKYPDDVARALAQASQQKATEEEFKTLAEVTITAKTKSNKELLNEKLSSGMFRTMNEDVFDLVNENQDAMSAMSIIQWLQGRVAGLQVQMQNGQYVPSIRGGRVGIFLDEMPVDISAINSLPVSNIAMVKVIKSGFMGGPGGGGNGSAIAIYTRRGDTQPANSAQKPPSLNSATIAGYDKVLPFVSPDYNDATAKRAQSDTRDALYWNPMVVPDGNKPINIRFFNNDNGKSVRVVIIGFSKDEDTPLFYNDIFR